MLTTQEQRAMEKKIVRKIDLHLMPLLILCYFLNYIDRTNLGSARTLNNDQPGQSLVDQLDLKGYRYSLVVAIFFVPYCLLEFPSNLLLKRFTPSKHISRIMVSWSIVTICTAAVKSYGGLIAVRLALGVMEAGFFPGCIYLMCFWYKPSERATRMAIFASSVALSGAFGSLIAAGVGEMNGLGNLHGWQWLFVLEGIPTFIVGVVVYFYLPDFPETARFLSDEERIFAVARLGEHAPKGTDKHFDKTAAIDCVKDWKFWCFALQYFAMTMSLNASGFFSPTIIAALGFKGTRGQLLNVVPNGFAFFIIIGNAWSSDRLKERPRHILAGLTLVTTGYILLAATSNVPTRFVGLCFIACTNAAVIPFLALRTATVSGATASAIATGGIIAIANSAGAVAPFLFDSKDSPRYVTGLSTVGGFLGLAFLLTIFLWWRLGSSSEYSTGHLKVTDVEEGEVDVDEKEKELGSGVQAVVKV